MAKARIHYLCRECGGVQSMWMGKCPDCGTWDALEKYIEPREPKANAHGIGAPLIGADDAATAQRLIDVAASDVHRTETGIGEFDRVLGGGIVRGSAVLIAGDPGIGKSTLLLQVAGAIAQTCRVLYVSSEESAYQTRLRAERILPADADSTGESGENLYVLADTNLARIIEQARTVDPAILVIDSIQMIHRSDVEAAPGSVTQLRRCVQDLVLLAKQSGMAVLLVGHVTKQGQIAGPKLVEHLVDTVLTFEGDRHHAYRVVRAIKNRFGTTLEIALLEMTSRGMVEVDNRALVHEATAVARAGSVVCPAMHGSRCLLVEVQALTAPGFLGNARRKASGLDTNRLTMLIAVLEKHGGLRLADQDVYVSTTGGLKVTEPGADLALSCAIAGAFNTRALAPGTVVFGEVGLGGEVRPVAHAAQRLAESHRMGFHTAIVPPGGPDAPAAMTVREAATLSDAIEFLDPVARAPAAARG